jgi:hypothetical protein
MVALRRALGWHRPLIAFAVAMGVLTLVTGLAWSMDGRTLAGAPIWAKPMKFSVSLLLYAVTLAWMLDRMPHHRRAGWWAGTVVAGAGAVEMAAITGQAVRGRQSHFNVSTPLDSALFSLMGATIAVLYVATLVVAVLLMRNRSQDPVATWAVRLGVVVALVGMSVGGLMLTPTPAQTEAFAAGTATLSGAHGVGVPDGGPGLPLLGWSTTGGDLRVGHFIGMHALQLLPLLALVLSGPRARRWGTPTRVRLVQLAAAAYTGVVVLTTWQALRGRPLLDPDGATVTAAGALVLLTLVALVVIARTARTARSDPDRPAPRPVALDVP